MELNELILPLKGDYSVGGPFRPYCVGCPLAKDGNFARIDGRGWTGVLALAEALGEEEAKIHRPLVGWTGEYFDKLVSKIKWPVPLDRDAFLLANVINCQPPKNKLSGQKYEGEALAKCRPYLTEILEKFKPKAILAMGGTAFRSLTGYTGLLGKPGWRGYVVPSIYGPVIPTFHPAFILRGKIGYSWFWLRDAQKALKVAAGEWKVASVNYTLRPTVEEGWAFVAEYEKHLAEDPWAILSADIETNWSPGMDEDEEEYFERPLEETASYQIARISFSHRERTAITFIFTAEFLPIIKRLLASVGPKGFWNAPFDVPRLEANDCPVLGRIYDVMLAWKAWQPQLRWSLAHAASALTDMPPWKHEAWGQPEWYSCCDADAPVRIFNIIRPIMIQSGQWEAYERHFVDLQQVLSILSRRGVPTDRALRAQTRQELAERFDRVVAEAQAWVPREIRSVHPKKGYKKTEEQLKKQGLWQEGEMVPLEVEVSDDELEARANKRAAAEAKKAERELRKAELAAARKVAAKLRKRAGKPAGGSGDASHGAEDGSPGVDKARRSAKRRKAAPAVGGTGPTGHNQGVPGEPTGGSNAGADRGDGQGERVAVVGSRSFAGNARVESLIRAYIDALPGDAVVVSGGAPGPDTVAETWAKARGRTVLVERPLGLTPKLLFARNTRVVLASDRLAAFWDGRSNGTEDAILKARAFNKPVEVIRP